MKFAVFYDGLCPLCLKEIGFYQKQRGAEQIEWIDVSKPTDTDPAPGLSRCDALRRFHVRDTNGQLLSGARAFGALWSVLPRFRWLGRIALLPLIAHVLELAYRSFLRVRPLIQNRLRKSTAHQNG